MALTTTLDDFWSQFCLPEAKESGAIDGDHETIRSAVKSLLVSAGWSDAMGRLSFVSDKDQSAAVVQAAVEVRRQSARAGNTRLTGAKQSRPGFNPTVASAAVLAETQAANRQELQAVVGTQNHLIFSVPKVGDKCPRCQSDMKVVGMVNDRHGLYCQKDRVVLPLPAGTVQT